MTTLNLTAEKNASLIHVYCFFVHFASDLVGCLGKAIIF